MYYLELKFRHEFGMQGQGFKWSARGSTLVNQYLNEKASAFNFKNIIFFLLTILLGAPCFSQDELVPNETIIQKEGAPGNLSWDQKGPDQERQNSVNENPRISKRDVIAYTRSGLAREIDHSRRNLPNIQSLYPHKGFDSKLVQKVLSIQEGLRNPESGSFSERMAARLFLFRHLGLSQFIQQNKQSVENLKKIFGNHGFETQIKLDRDHFILEAKPTSSATIYPILKKYFSGKLRPHIRDFKILVDPLTNEFVEAYADYPFKLGLNMNSNLIEKILAGNLDPIFFHEIRHLYTNTKHLYKVNTPTLQVFSSKKGFRTNSDLGNAYRFDFRFDELVSQANDMKLNHGYESNYLEPIAETVLFETAYLLNNWNKIDKIIAKSTNKIVIYYGEDKTFTGTIFTDLTDPITTNVRIRGLLTSMNHSAYQILMKLNEMELVGKRSKLINEIYNIAKKDSIVPGETPVRMDDKHWRYVVPAESRIPKVSTTNQASVIGFLSTGFGGIFAPTAEGRDSVGLLNWLWEVLKQKTIEFENQIDNFLNVKITEPEINEPNELSESQNKERDKDNFEPEKKDESTKSKRKKPLRYYKMIDILTEFNLLHPDKLVFSSETLRANMQAIQETTTYKISYEIIEEVFQKYGETKLSDLPELVLTPESLKSYLQIQKTRGFDQPVSTMKDAIKRGVIDLTENQIETITQKRPGLYEEWYFDGKEPYILPYDPSQVHQSLNLDDFIKIIHRWNSAPGNQKRQVNTTEILKMRSLSLGFQFQEFLETCESNHISSDAFFYLYGMFTVKGSLHPGQNEIYDDSVLRIFKKNFRSYMSTPVKNGNLFILPILSTNALDLSEQKIDPNHLHSIPMVGPKSSEELFVMKNILVKDTPDNLGISESDYRKVSTANQTRPHGYLSTGFGGIFAPTAEGRESVGLLNWWLELMRHHAIEAKEWIEKYAGKTIVNIQKRNKKFTPENDSKYADFPKSETPDSNQEDKNDQTEEKTKYQQVEKFLKFKYEWNMMTPQKRIEKFRDKVPEIEKIAGVRIDSYGNTKIVRKKFGNENWEMLNPDILYLTKYNKILLDKVQKYHGNEGERIWTAGYRTVEQQIEKLQLEIMDFTLNHPALLVNEEATNTKLQYLESLKKLTGVIDQFYEKSNSISKYGKGTSSEIVGLKEGVLWYNLTHSEPLTTEILLRDKVALGRLSPSDLTVVLAKNSLTPPDIGIVGGVGMANTPKGHNFLFPILFTGDSNREPPEPSIETQIKWIQYKIDQYNRNKPPEEWIHFTTRAQPNTQEHLKLMQEFEQLVDYMVLQENEKLKESETFSLAELETNPDHLRSIPITGPESLEIMFSRHNAWFKGNREKQIFSVSDYEKVYVSKEFDYFSFPPSVLGDHLKQVNWEKLKKQSIFFLVNIITTGNEPADKGHKDKNTWFLEFQRNIENFIARKQITSGIVSESTIEPVEQKSKKSVQVPMEKLSENIEKRSVNPFPTNYNVTVENKKPVGNEKKAITQTVTTASLLRQAILMFSENGTPEFREFYEIMNKLENRVHLADMLMIENLRMKVNALLKAVTVHAITTKQYQFLGELLAKDRLMSNYINQMEAKQSYVLVRIMEDSRAAKYFINHHLWGDHFRKNPLIYDGTSVIEATTLMAKAEYFLNLLIETDVFRDHEKLLRQTFVKHWNNKNREKRLAAINAKNSLLSAANKTRVLDFRHRSQDQIIHGLMETVNFIHRINSLSNEEISREFEIDSSFKDFFKNNIENPGDKIIKDRKTAREIFKLIPSHYWKGFSPSEITYLYANNHIPETFLLLTEKYRGFRSEDNLWKLLCEDIDSNNGKQLMALGRTLSYFVREFDRLGVTNQNSFELISHDSDLGTYDTFVKLLQQYSLKPKKFWEVIKFLSSSDSTSVQNLGSLYGLKSNAVSAFKEVYGNPDQKIQRTRKPGNDFILLNFIGPQNSNKYVLKPLSDFKSEDRISDLERVVEIIYHYNKTNLELDRNFEEFIYSERTLKEHCENLQTYTGYEITPELTERLIKRYQLISQNFQDYVLPASLLKNHFQSYEKRMTTKLHSMDDVMHNRVIRLPEEVLRDAETRFGSHAWFFSGGAPEDYQKPSPPTYESALSSVLELNKQNEGGIKIIFSENTYSYFQTREKLVSLSVLKNLCEDRGIATSEFFEAVLEKFPSGDFAYRINNLLQGYENIHSESYAMEKNVEFFLQEFLNQMIHEFNSNPNNVSRKISTYEDYENRRIREHWPNLENFRKLGLHFDQSILNAVKFSMDASTDQFPRNYSMRPQLPQHRGWILQTWDKMGVLWGNFKDNVVRLASKISTGKTLHIETDLSSDEKIESKTILSSPEDAEMVANGPEKFIEINKNGAVIKWTLNDVYQKILEFNGLPAKNGTNEEIHSTLTYEKFRNKAGLPELEMFRRLCTENKTTPQNALHYWFRPNNVYNNGFASSAELEPFVQSFKTKIFSIASDLQERRLESKKKQLTIDLYNWYTASPLELFDMVMSGIRLWNFSHPESPIDSRETYPMISSRAGLPPLKNVEKILVNEGFNFDILFKNALDRSGSTAIFEGNWYDRILTTILGMTRPENPVSLAIETLENPKTAESEKAIDPTRFDSMTIHELAQELEILKQKIIHWNLSNPESKEIVSRMDIETKFKIANLPNTEELKILLAKNNVFEVNFFDQIHSETNLAKYYYWKREYNRNVLDKSPSTVKPFTNFVDLHNKFEQFPSNLNEIIQKSGNTTDNFFARENMDGGIYSSIKRGLEAMVLELPIRPRMFLDLYPSKDTTHFEKMKQLREKHGLPQTQKELEKVIHNAAKTSHQFLQPSPRSVIHSIADYQRFLEYFEKYKGMNGYELERALLRLSAETEKVDIEEVLYLVKNPLVPELMVVAAICNLEENEKNAEIRTIIDTGRISVEGLEKAIQWAAGRGKYSLVEKLANLPEMTPKGLSVALKKAAKYGELTIVDYLANHKDLPPDAISLARKYIQGTSYTEVANFLKTKAKELESSKVGQHGSGLGPIIMTLITTNSAGSSVYGEPHKETHPDDEKKRKKSSKKKTMKPNKSPGIDNPGHPVPEKIKTKPSSDLIATKVTSVEEMIKSAENGNKMMVSTTEPIKLLGSGQEVTYRARIMDSGKAEERLQEIVNEMKYKIMEPERLRELFEIHAQEIADLSKIIGSDKSKRASLIKLLGKAMRDIEKPSLVSKFPAEFGRFFSALTLAHLFTVMNDEGISTETFVDILKGLPVEFLHFGTFSAAASATSTTIDALGMIQQKLMQQHSSQALEELKQLQSLSKTPLSFMRTQASARMYMKSQFGMLAGIMVNMMLYDRQLTGRQILDAAVQTQVSFMIAGAVVRGIVIRGGGVVLENLLLRRGLTLVKGARAATIVGIVTLAAELVVADPINRKISKIRENSEYKAAMYESLLRLEYWLAGGNVPKMVMKDTCLAKSDDLERGQCYAQQALAGLESYLVQMVYRPVHELTAKYSQKQNDLEKESTGPWEHLGINSSGEPVMMSAWPKNNYQTNTSSLWNNYTLESKETISEIRSEIPQTLLQQLRVLFPVNTMIPADGISNIEFLQQVQSTLKDQEKAFYNLIDLGRHQGQKEDWEYWRNERVVNHQKKIDTDVMGIKEWGQLVMYTMQRIGLRSQPKNDNRKLVQMLFSQQVMNLFSEAIQEKLNVEATPKKFTDVYENGYWNYAYEGRNFGKWQELYFWTEGPYYQGTIEPTKRAKLKVLSQNYPAAHFHKDTISVISPRGSEKYQRRVDRELLVDLAYFYRCKSLNGEGTLVEKFVNDKRGFEQNYKYQEAKSEFLKKNVSAIANDPMGVGFDAVPQAANQQQVVSESPAAWFQVYVQPDVVRFGDKPLLEPYAVIGITKQHLQTYAQPFYECRY